MVLGGKGIPVFRRSLQGNPKRRIVFSKDNYTLSLAMQLFSSSEAGTEFTTVMAMAVLSMLIPVLLYLIFQRYIMSTFASSGIKG